ncbi:hypothetical protein AMTR_s00146p00045810, partial [Amborella trichopoda]
ILGICGPSMAKSRALLVGLDLMAHEVAYTIVVREIVLMRISFPSARGRGICGGS